MIDTPPNSAPSTPSRPTAVPDWDALRREWSRRPGVTYLNHGSFGPSPRPVLEAQRQFQAELVAEPMDFFVRQQPELLRRAFARLGEFIGASPDNLVPVDNATTGMNVIADSVRLSQGDEVLFTDHEYGAVTRIWERKCRDTGAQLITQPLPRLLCDRGEVVETLFRGATPRTKIVVVSHITSPTAVILPVDDICREARRRKIAVAIDGPHAPAIAPLALDRLDCDYYTASCHKWLSAPFGSGFLYVHPRRQADVRPSVLSWGRNPPGEQPSWRDEFTWVGTRDFASYLALPAAIDFLAQRVGWEHFRRRVHDLAQKARQRIVALTGLEPFVADSPEWYGSMIACPLPPGEAQPLQDALWEQDRIEVPIVDWNGQRFVRVSCHLYTTDEHLDQLTAALKRLVYSP